MANEIVSNIKVDFLRKNSADNYERLIVSTIPSQVIGLLDANDKISSLWLPSYITGGMRYTSAISFNSTHTFSDFWGKAGLQTLLDSEGQNLAGRYFIAGTSLQDFQLDSFTVQYSGATFDVDYDTTSIATEDISGTTLKLEAGDWLVFSKVEILEPTETSPAGTVRLKLEIVNNTYQDATTTAKGIVQLASNINGTDNGVVTGKKLYDNLTTLIGSKHPIISPPLNTTGYLNYFTVNSQGHITTAEYKVATSAIQGFIQLATVQEAKNASDEAKAMTASTTKQAIDYYGGIRYYTSLPNVSTIAEGCIIAVLAS